MERITARTDLDDLHIARLHVRERMLAERCSTSSTAVTRVNRENLDDPMVPRLVDAPGELPDELRLVFRDGNEPVVVGIVQTGHHLVIVRTPSAVLMGKNRIADDGAEGFLVKRAEGLDGELDQLVEVTRVKGRRSTAMPFD
jgi:hypothetical protein